MKKEVVGVGVNGTNVSVLYNALVIENYRRDPDDSILRKQFGINGGMFLLGNIGRLSPEKGQADFIKAAAEVLKHHKNVKFALIGSGSDEIYLRELVDELNIRDSVIFTGYRNDMMQVYNSLDLVVQSSHTEGMPNVILEALAMEKPVIATDVGGTPEVIINNQTGILVRPGDPRELAGKIIEYLKNPGVLAGMVKNGRELIEMKFNFTERTKKLCRIYNALVREKAKNEVTVA
jgi:glycosyltransferase involved in cell wall biosynthesis